MEKAIEVLQNRMREYKNIGSDKAIEYYWSCNKAVNELEKIQEIQSDSTDTIIKCGECFDTKLKYNDSYCSDCE